MSDELYEWPDGWETVTLADVAEFTRGISFPASAKKSEPSKDALACLRTANIQETLDWQDLIYVSKEYVHGHHKYLHDNDILISMANSLELVGKVAFVDKPKQLSTFGGFISAIRCNERVAPRYLYHLLRSTQIKEQFRQTASRSVNIANLSLSAIYPTLLPLPPLPEQHRIVKRIEALLSENRIAREALEQVPALLKRFRQSVLAKAFRGELTERDPNDEPASALLARIRAERRRTWVEDLQAKGKDPKKAIYALPEPPDTSELPELPVGWCWAAVEEACERIVDCLHSTPKFTSAGFACVDLTCILPGEVVRNKLRYVDDETFHQRNSAHEAEGRRCDV